MGTMRVLPESKLGKWLSLTIAAFLTLAAISIAVPTRLDTRCANAAAAIATLSNLWSAQESLQASGAIDCDGDGVGEFGYFAELAGARPLRTSGKTKPGQMCSPPLVSAAFGYVHEYGVLRSGYYFRLYLPDRSASGIPESSSGGAAKRQPDPDRAERLWCCYAWPASIVEGGTRAFFINQTGTVLAYDNEDARYVGTSRMPEVTSAFRAGSRLGMASSIARDATGNDGLRWRPVE